MHLTDSYYSSATLDVDVEKGRAEDDEPTNPARRLSKWQLRHQRLLFGSLVLALNATCIVCSAVGYSGLWVLIVILFFKSKDFFSVWIQIFCGLYHSVKKLFAKPPVKQSSWILSLIPACKYIPRCKASTSGYRDVC